MQHNINIQLDDRIYQPLMEKVGEENLNQFISNLIEPYLLANQPTTEVEFKKNRTNRVQAMAGCLAEYAKPHLIAQEQAVLDDALTQEFKEKYGVN